MVMRGVYTDGETVRSVRTHRGLTQEELADLAGLDVKTVRKAERGGRLDLSTLTRLAVAMETVTGRLVRHGLSEMGLLSCRRDAVLRWLAAWDARDADGVLALYHERATFRLPGRPVIPFHGTCRGKDEIRAAYETAWRTCQTVPASPEDVMIYVMGDTVVLEGLRGVRLPNGEISRLWCVQIYSFDGDRVIDHRVVYDTLEFARLMEISVASAVGEEQESSR